MKEFRACGADPTLVGALKSLVSEVGLCIKESHMNDVRHWLLLRRTPSWTKLRLMHL